MREERAQVGADAKNGAGFRAVRVSAIYFCVKRTLLVGQCEGYAEAEGRVVDQIRTGRKHHGGAQNE